jgi:hypothetical protein
MKKILNDWLLDVEIPKSPSGKYYMRDTRSIVGNSCTWWALGSRGYTCEVRCAEIFDEERALQQQKSRGTDQPWPVEIIDRLVTHHIDIQDLPHMADRHHMLIEYGVPTK